jgi:hypothetical protein
MVIALAVPLNTASTSSRRPDGCDLTLTVDALGIH